MSWAKSLAIVSPARLAVAAFATSGMKARARAALAMAQRCPGAARSLRKSAIPRISEPSPSATNTPKAENEPMKK
jgi:hypothetical protein